MQTYLHQFHAESALKYLSCSWLRRPILFGILFRSLSSVNSIRVSVMLAALILNCLFHQWIIFLLLCWLQIWRIYPVAGRVVEYCRGIKAEHKLLLPLLMSLLFLVVVVLYLSLLLLYFSYSKGDFGVMTGRRKINFLRFHSIFNCSSSFFSWSAFVIYFENLRLFQGVRVQKQRPQMLQHIRVLQGS